MNNEVVITGNAGPEVRSDCQVTLQITDRGGRDLTIDSKVDTLYGEQISTLATAMLDYFGIQYARLHIKDTGAFDYVLAARIEAAVRGILPDVEPYLPDFIVDNNIPSSAKRMRFSRLYVPGNSPKMMINAGIYGTHGVILDLEDAVAPDKKVEARILVRNALRQVDFYGAERMVRINQLPFGLADLTEIIPHNVHLVLLPKCESKDQIDTVNVKIKELTQKHNLNNEVFLMPIIESARGVGNAYEIASAAENVVAVAIGLEDYCADMGVVRTTGSQESLYAKSVLVNACCAAGVQAIDSVFSDFQDKAGLIETVRQAKSLGFQGIGCIHPAQVPVVNDIFSPSEDEIAKAKQVVLCYEDALSQGRGVVALGSKMIDPPVVERSIQVINRAVAVGRLSENWRTANA